MNPTRFNRFLLVTGAGIFFAVNAPAQPAALTPAAVGATPAVVTPERVSGTETQDGVRAYLQVQEQIHATQLAIERNRQEAEEIAGRNALAFAERLNSIDKILGEQRTREVRSILIAAGAIAGFGLLVMFLISYMQTRVMNRFSETMLALPLQQMQQFGGGSAPQLLGAGAAETNARLTATIERLENRIRELEAGAPATPALTVVPPVATAEASAAHQIEALLAKGQSQLGQGQVAEAVATFDAALALDPNHVEALIKKGPALEKLSKLDEAIACYDRAIAADSSVTIAYLYKGGVFNRLERYNEALACYELALKTQEKAHAA